MRLRRGRAAPCGTSVRDLGERTRAPRDLRQRHLRDTYTREGRRPAEHRAHGLTGNADCLDARHDSMAECPSMLDLHPAPQPRKRLSSSLECRIVQKFPLHLPSPTPTSCPVDDRTSSTETRELPLPAPWLGRTADPTPAPGTARLSARGNPRTSKPHSSRHGLQCPTRETSTQNQLQGAPDPRERAPRPPF